MAKNKLTICKACGAEMAKSAKSCPHCGARNKKPIFKRWWFWVIVIVLLSSIGNSGKRANRKDAPKSNTIPSQTVSQTASTTPVTTVATEPVPTETEAAVVPEETVPKANSTGIDPDFKAAMDAYESFYVEYCDLLKKYMANPTDLTILLKYSEMMSKADEMNQAFEAWDENDLNNEELKYYLDVNNRVMQLLVDISG